MEPKSKLLTMLDSNNKTAEEAYFEISNQIKELEEIKAKLNEEILTKMNENGETNLKTDTGEFILAWRKSWEYSTDTEMINEKYKAAKKREEKDGTAKIKSQTEYLRFLPKKVEVSE